MSQLLDVYQEWQNNPHFRELFKKDPLLALKEVGFELNPEDLKKIQTIIQKETKDNGTLEGRINK